MKLLFDQNLSHRLPVRVGDLYPTTGKRANRPFYY